ncbi:hypothetical protein HPT29_007175 [Microvirga terrae]|uniref:Uncharacterized protein n=1 Tax=Microvirga terrae TaxID=2740529 RepID=A0ABY5RZ79_9HYPH|nr:hypothetical protein [Microvirga terrae]UVF22157.1 hypothetical protein HPT29_007175 [Microvirga terrae]
MEEAFATFFTDVFFAGALDAAALDAAALEAAALLAAFAGALAAFDDAFAAALGAAAFLAGAFFETLVAVLAIRNSFVDGECIRQQTLNNAFSQELKMRSLAFRTIVTVTCRFLVNGRPNARRAVPRARRAFGPEVGGKQPEIRYRALAMLVSVIVRGIQRGKIFSGCLCTGRRWMIGWHFPCRKIAVLTVLDRQRA